MIEVLCLGGPLNGQRVKLDLEKTSYTYPELAGDDLAFEVPPFGSGYYAWQKREIDGRVERVLRWEGEL